MKNIKKYEIFESDDLEDNGEGPTMEQFFFLNKVAGDNWDYDRSTGLVNVHGDVKFGANDTKSQLKCKDFNGVQFGEVTGDFVFRNCGLESLEGAPTKVGGKFLINNHSLKSLEGGPIEVGRDYDAWYNPLVSLAGFPVKVGGKFDCSYFGVDTGEFSIPKIVDEIGKINTPKIKSLVLTLFSDIDMLNDTLQKYPQKSFELLSMLKKYAPEIWKRFEDESGESMTDMGDLGDLGF